MAEVMTAADADHPSPSSHQASHPSDLASDHAGPSRYRFRPTRHLYEPPAPPPQDHKVEEELAAQAAALAAGFEGRKMRRFLQRRTVDYMGSWLKYKDHRMRSSTPRRDYFLKPSPHWVVDLLPAAASCLPASSAAPHLVHTSLNKIRTPVNCVTWLPSSRRLLTGSSSGEFTLWNGLTFNFETILQACDNGVRDLQWSHSGNLLLSGDAGGAVKYFLPNMNNVLAIEAHKESIRGISFSPDDARWISASDDHTIKIWNTERGLQESELRGHGWDVKCAQWHPFKGLIASGGKDNMVKFWDPRRGGREIATYHGHKNTIQAMQFSPNHISSGELLATASRDQTVKLYDLRMVREYMTFKAAPVDGGSSETGGVCSLSWHPYSQLLSSGLSTGTLQHHSLLPSATPEMPISTVFQAHDQSIWAMSWHPLGQILATGGNDCYTRWWQRERLEEGDLKAVKEEEGTVDGTGTLKRKTKSTWGEDEDEADASSSSFIPGFGTSAHSSRGDALEQRNREPFQQKRDRPPPPPGFGIQDDFPKSSLPSQSFGGGGGGGGGGGAGVPPPRATGANVGARDTGWGRGRHGGIEGGAEYTGGSDGPSSYGMPGQQIQQGYSQQVQATFPPGPPPPQPPFASSSEAGAFTLPGLGYASTGSSAQMQGSEVMMYGGGGGGGGGGGHTGQPHHQGQGQGYPSYSLPAGGSDQQHAYQSYQSQTQTQAQGQGQGQQLGRGQGGYSYGR